MRIRTLSLAAGLAFALAALTPSAALAAPSIGVEVDRTPAIVPSNDEQVIYRIAVRNNATALPAVGDELNCERGEWRLEDQIAYEFSYQWVRAGMRLESAADIDHGSQTPTYTVQADDAGKTLQCLVAGANPNVENSVDHTTGHRIAAVQATLPPTLVGPAPAGRIPSAPKGTGRALASGGATGAGAELTCTAPTSDWNTLASADTTVGSAVLTDVITARGDINRPTVGENRVFLNSNPVTGGFEVGQTIRIGYPEAQELTDPGVKIVAIEGNALVLSGPIKIVGVDTVLSYPIKAGANPLQAGHAISGAGIAPGSTIVSVSGRTVTLSAPAVASADDIALKDEAAGIGIWSFEWMLNGVPRLGGPGEGEVTATSPTTSTFKVTAGEVEQPGLFQCTAIASNASGSAAAASNPARTAEPAPKITNAIAPNALGVDVAPFVDAENATTEPIELAIELPGGEETRAVNVEGSGWSCDTQEPAGAGHAGVICARPDSLAPEEGYPEVKVTASTGADLVVPAVTVAEVFEGGAQVARAEDSFVPGAPVPFGIDSLSTAVLDQAGDDYTQAGGHPLSAGVGIRPKTRVGRDGKRAQIEFLRDIRTDTPPGFVANPKAAPQKCETIAEVLSDTYDEATCPRGSIVGSVDVDTAATGVLVGLPFYVMEPEPGNPAQLVFSINGYPVSYSLIPRLRPEDGYAISVDAPVASKNPVIFSAAVKLCGYGVNVGPTQTGSPYKGAPQILSCKKPGDEGANPIPFVTNPTECTGKAPVTTVAVSSWEHPNDFKAKDALSPPVTGCEDVPFDPAMDLAPTSAQADSPTGLKVELSMPTDGLETPGEIAQSALKKAEVTLPPGMVVNPSAADGLGACSSSQIKLATNDPISCPDSSKVGEVEVTTPLLEETLKGNVYLAKQNDNPFDSLLALYLVVESKERGLLVKIPGKVEPDPSTGQLKTTFDDNPQVPFSSLTLDIDPGYRAPLISPPKCGSYQITSKLYPYSAPGSPVTRTSDFQVTQGPYGRPCPSGALEPKLDAGVKSPIAGSVSPFLLNLSREDGTDRISGLELSLPPGLSAYLQGVPYCSDAALASVSGDPGTGQAQIDSPSCPAASQIGTVAVKAGAGPAPFYVDTARAYLAGPYKGAPLSIAVIAPAVAGPFDLGSVVVRNAAHVDPATAQITVKADPIPTILHGIPLDIREIRVAVDRPSFTLAPTSCAEMSVGARVFGQAGGFAEPSNRFQVGDCGRLAFKPHLNLKLKGGTKRGKNPKLIATLRARPGDANLSALSVRLPRSAFLDQSHIRTICTRVQWAADACPKGSIYGKVWVKTPLLDYTLTGNVHLRSSNNKLPDLVTDLRGPSYQPLKVELSGRTDSVKGALRNSFDFLPDAPFTQARLVLFGGKRGLVVNSRDICRHRYRAAVSTDAQNGKIRDFRPLVRNSCKQKRKKHRAHRRAIGKRVAKR